MNRYIAVGLLCYGLAFLMVIVFIGTILFSSIAKAEYAPVEKASVSYKISDPSITFEVFETEQDATDFVKGKPDCWVSRNTVIPDETVDYHVYCGNVDGMFVGMEG